MLGLPDMGHSIPGATGLMVRMGVLYIQMVAYEAKTKIRKNHLRCQASRRLQYGVPNKRLHISGEYYVH